MFCDPEKVGHFAVTPRELEAGDGGALFRLLIAIAMFQRRQDVQILRILRAQSASRVRELTNSRTLLRLADQGRCPHRRTNEALVSRCDLSKRDGIGVCGQRPRTPCELKVHTVWLRRYGHFGKVPTSIALMLRERGVPDLSALRAQVLASAPSPSAAAEELERALCAAWRVNQKIANMFLSLVSNPDLLEGWTAPWAAGLDWTRFVVVDSNVDLFLRTIDYEGPRSYDGRRAFVRALARRIDLREFDRRVSEYNPRLLQQALYLFMSSTNRRALPRDCSRAAPISCAGCPSLISSVCALARVVGV